ncbi:helix-turn-helix transcriptional regulator [Algoriphagus boritolerans]|uniref:helix-turn-helix domain-containing protein n=1 Tax=Algoriphagus boritolerans TaxID=308111 RepID=UPI000A65AB6C
MKETFGEYIHNLRVEHGLTLTKLAASLDIDQSTLSKIENQKRSIPEEILPKLAKIFKLDIKKLENEFYSEKNCRNDLSSSELSRTIDTCRRKS